MERRQGRWAVAVSTVPIPARTGARDRVVYGPLPRVDHVGAGRRADSDPFHRRHRGLPDCAPSARATAGLPVSSGPG
jgi:hypothetical protein